MNIIYYVYEHTHIYICSIASLTLLSYFPIHLKFINFVNGKNASVTYCILFHFNFCCKFIILSYPIRHLLLLQFSFSRNFVSHLIIKYVIFLEY